MGLASAVIRKVIEEIGKKNHQCPLRRIEEITDEMNFTKEETSALEIFNACLVV